MLKMSYEKKISFLLHLPWQQVFTLETVLIFCLFMRVLKNIYYHPLFLSLSLSLLSLSLSLSLSLPSLSLPLPKGFFPFYVPTPMLSLVDVKG